MRTGGAQRVCVSRCLWPVVIGFVLVCGFAAACERVDVRPVTGGGAAPENSEPATVAVHLAPAFFNTASMAELQPSIRAAGEIEWEGGTLVRTLDDGTEIVLSLPPTEFDLVGLSLEALDDSLDVTATYRHSDEDGETGYRATARLGTDVAICRVELGLQLRTLSLALRPISPDGTAAWDATVQESGAFSAGVPIDHVFLDPEPCDPFQDLDWPALLSDVDALLADHASEIFAGQLRDLVASQLPLPTGGLIAVPSGSSDAFFRPESVQITTRVASVAPWSGGGFRVDETDGVKLALDTAVSGEIARCVEGIEIPKSDPASLRARTLPMRTPNTNEAWLYVLALDEAFVAQILRQLVLSGYLCVDAPANEPDALPAMDTLIDGLRRARGVTFGRGGRARLQPLDTLTVRSTGGAGLTWSLDAARLDVYAETDDAVLLRAAQLDGAYEIDTEVEIENGGNIAIAASEVAPTLETMDTELLDEVGVNVIPGNLAATVMGAMVDDLIELPAPRPFDLDYQILEIESSAGAFWIYVGLK